MEFLLPGGLLVFMLSALVIVKVDLAKRPTWTEANKRFKDTKVCDEIHKSVNEKLECIPEIKETVIEIRTILKERNKK
ncbi:hypothetical protein LCGC14_1759080 [marine sediment metagenome]|uniref:Uncharacterized protein n=1 Tax=marine sediment metagenome TaxID=412755 RepID=A0A0F9HNX2_9ZZZZ